MNAVTVPEFADAAIRVALFFAAVWALHRSWVRSEYAAAKEAPARVLAVRAFLMVFWLVAATCAASLVW